jgi:hypothetical protein
MEHRCTPRIAMQVNVVVHVTGTTLVNGITRNISSDGICFNLKETRDLRKDSGDKIKRNQTVRVALNAGKGLVIIPALVLRRHENAIALVFSEDASRKKQLLKDYLYGAPENGSEPLRVCREL